MTMSNEDLWKTTKQEGPEIKWKEAEMGSPHFKEARLSPGHPKVMCRRSVEWEPNFIGKRCDCSLYRPVEDALCSRGS